MKLKKTALEKEGLRLDRESRILSREILKLQKEVLLAIDSDLFISCDDCGGSGFIHDSVCGNCTAGYIGIKNSND